MLMYMLPQVPNEDAYPALIVGGEDDAAADVLEVQRRSDRLRIPYSHAYSYMDING
jgi:hypothetical protein